MDRKIVIIALIICVCLSLTSNAFAYTSYDQGNISTTYVTYFDDIVDGLPYNYHYVATRSGQYEYILHASDSLRFDNDTFISDDGITYRISTSSGYNATYEYSSFNEHNFQLNTNDQMVYSDLGQYPRLDERGSVYEFSLLTTAIICCICLLIRPIFKYLLRTS